MKVTRKTALSLLLVTCLLTSCSVLSNLKGPEETNAVIVDASEVERIRNKSPIVSVELVSQEKPLVFYELMEQPKIEGIKVKLTYKDGCSEITDAWELKRTPDPEDADFEFWSGMFFYTGMYPANGNNTKQELLAPGTHYVAMYCANSVYGYYSTLFDWTLSRNPEETGEGVDLPYCMVEVYAQTLEDAGVPYGYTTSHFGGQRVNI